MTPPSPDSSPTERRLLVVMRHAKAEAFAVSDHQRVLTSRGRREAAAAGHWLASQGYVPTHAFVSSAARAQATWEAVAAASGGTPRVSVEEGLYAAGPDSVLDTLRTAPEDAAVVIFVGHNPTAASLAHVLDDGDPDMEAFRSMSAGLSTSAMAVLEVGVPWADLGAGTARLVAFHAGNA